MSEFTQFQKIYRLTPEWCFYYDDVAFDYERMYHNARIIFRILMNDNNRFSRNAVAAIVGNMQAESTINPGRHQVGGPGLGLVQWDPPTHYTDWADTIDIYGWYDGYGQMNWINTETDREGPGHPVQWGPTGRFPLSWQEFKSSTSSAAYLAKAFVLNFERPADQSEGVLNYRAALAQNWLQVSLQDDWQPGIPEQLPKDAPIPVWMLSLIMRRIK